LGRASHPQTTTEPATAWMRAAWQLLERQWPWSVLAVALAIVLVVSIALRRRPTGEGRHPADVAHALWVPAVGPRQEVLPERRRTFTFTPERAGEFAGQCVELCGVAHAYSRPVANVRAENGQGPDR
jgi:hypothetical protein